MASFSHSLLRASIGWGEGCRIKPRPNAANILTNICQSSLLPSGLHWGVLCWLPTGWVGSEKTPPTSLSLILWLISPALAGLRREERAHPPTPGEQPQPPREPPAAQRGSVPLRGSRKTAAGMAESGEDRGKAREGGLGSPISWPKRVPPGSGGAEWGGSLQDPGLPPLSPQERERERTAAMRMGKGSPFSAPCGERIWFPCSTGCLAQTGGPPVESVLDTSRQQRQTEQNGGGGKHSGSPIFMLGFYPRDPS